MNRGTCPVHCYIPQPPIPKILNQYLLSEKVVNGWKDARMVKRLENRGWMMGRWIDEAMDVWTDIWIDGRMGGWMDVRKDG